MEYKIRDVQWYDEKVKRFWDFYNNYPAFDHLCFSKANLTTHLTLFISVKN